MILSLRSQLSEANDLTAIRRRAAATRREVTQSLLLSRALVVEQVRAARDERFRAQRQCTLEGLDVELRKLGWTPASAEEDGP